MKVFCKFLRTLPALLLLALCIPGCGAGETRDKRQAQPIYPKGLPAMDYYFPRDKSESKVFLDLFSLLASETESSGDQFALVRQIASEYMKVKEHNKLINFLTSWVNTHPLDPYNAYYLLLTAYTYMELEAAPVAAMYFDLIIKNYADLDMPQGESIHLICLKRLIELVDKPEREVEYYQELISRFPGRIDFGTAYFMLGQAYEKTGQWDEAIKSYTQFLPYVGTQISGFADAFGYAKQLVDFNNSPKDWTFESLNSMVSAIKSAIDRRSSNLLHQYKAKVGFFARSWEQDSSESGAAEFNFSDFMRGNPVRYEAELDKGSNANEAFLRTWGWSQYISVWYLYFRKIYFPSNPEIHGRWEWTGIYYGEKF